MRLAKSLLALGLLVSAPGCSEPTAKPSAEAPPHTTAATSVAVPTGLLRRVQPNTVCMMNNRFMDAEQIPVVVEGRTYFGCCAMCKDKLENDAAARTGKDPVSGKPVDKAGAIIGVKPNGTVLYFESEATFAAYRGEDAPAATPVAAPAASAPAPSASASTAPAAPASPSPPRGPGGPAPAAPPPAAPPPVTPPPAAPPPAPPPPASPAPTVDHSAHKGH